MNNLRHLFKPGPASGRQYFQTVVDQVMAKPCARCGHTMDDHGIATGPMAAFRRDQCHECRCPGFRHQVAG